MRANRTADGFASVANAFFINAKDRFAIGAGEQHQSGPFCYGHAVMTLSKVTRMTESEKGAVRWRFGKGHGLDFLNETPVSCYSTAGSNEACADKGSSRSADYAGPLERNGKMVARNHGHK
tara:strand:+ start:164 stop:526 length:363 start_codon:yes stop_codon:yes gene_type:complete